MKVYHYSAFDDWREITSSRGETQNPGLQASRRIGQEDESALKTRALFALLNPLPEEWINNKYFEEIWGKLRRKVGILLLEIDVDFEKDEAFVLDRGHMEGFLYESKASIPEKYLHPSRKAAERAYMESRVPVREYLTRKKELEYAIPEVIFLQNIPLRQVRVSNEQPFIEEELQRATNEYQRRLILRIQEIPELVSWYENRKVG